MAIGITDHTGPYTANGSQAVFPFDFTAMSDGEVGVLVNGTAISSALYMVERTDTGGSVAFLSAPGGGSLILIVSQPDFSQLSEFENQGGYNLTTINAINRRSAVKDAWLASTARRALTSPIGEDDPLAYFESIGFKGDKGDTGDKGDKGEPGGDTGLTLSSKVRAATKPTERAPGIADDSTQGYAAGDVWGVEDGKLYMCSTAQAGKAVWAVNDLSNMPMGKNLLPLDRITGASLAIAPWKLRAAYAGNCFQVQRDSDSTTLDIGFVWDSARKVYVADWEACDKFIEGTANAWYTIIYDQSGNGYNLTATSFKVYIISSAIGTTTRNDINGLRVFSFWGGTRTEMAIPVGHSVSRQNCTIIGAGVIAASGHSNSYCELGNDASYLNRLLLTTIARDGRVQPIGNVNLVGTRAESSPHVIGAGFGSGVSDYMCNDDTTTASGLGAFTLTGGFVGSANGGGYTYWGDYAALIVYPTKRTTAEMQTLRQMISRVMRLRPQARDRLILVGDSITVGADASVQPWWRQTLPMFNRDFKVFNNGLEGDTAVAAIASVATQVTSSVKAGVTNVVVYAYGTNDLAALAPANGDAVNAATVQGRIQAHCAAIRAANSTAKIVVCTILPRNNSFTGGQTVTSFEASRLLINTWIRANYTTFADAIADYGGDPFVGQLANVTDGTWMNGNLHPKARGHAYMGAYVAAAVNGLG